MTTPVEFHVITADVIEDLIWHNPQKIYDTVKNTYLIHGQGQTINPNSYFLKFPDKPFSRIIALPSAIRGNDKMCGIKWIGSNPDNISKGFPRASAVIILNDYETGYPFACLEGSLISAVRTAFSSILAAEHMLGKKHIQHLGMVGTGFIAQFVYKALLTQGWEIEHFILYDKNRMHAKNFIKENLSEKKALIADDLKSVLKKCDLISFTTTSSEPYINDPKIFAHNPVLLNISLRDFSPEILLASNNVVDDIDHVLSANTSPDLTYKACGHKNFINGTIDKLILGKCKLNTAKPSIFSPMGMGILDLAVATHLYKLAITENKSTLIPNFFLQ